ncbi:hypothetical protein [Streptomyces tibetensis]|uniref:hypothetical protein n=1 Tax=Streptomyces tibetensis TaxID=2382123 RepID=UPI00340E616D
MQLEGPMRAAEAADEAHREVLGWINIGRLLEGKEPSPVPVAKARCARLPVQACWRSTGSTTSRKSAAYCSMSMRKRVVPGARANR